MISLSACLTFLLILLTPQTRRLVLDWLQRIYHWLFETITMTKTTSIHPRNLKEQCVFELTPMDVLQAAIPQIAFSLFYDQAVDPVKFKDALEKTLVYYPYLSGRIHRTSNRKQAPFQVHVHPSKGGASFATTQIQNPYPSKDDHRWFPFQTGTPFPFPHEPHFTYGPLLKIKITHVASTNSSVVSFGFCHAVMDATTVGAFLETLKAQYNSTASEIPPAPKMGLERVSNPNLKEGSAEPLERFTACTLLKAIQKVMARIQHLNITVEKSELQRLKTEFLAIDSELERTRCSTYEMLGVVLMRAFYKASRDELETSGTSEIECRCIVDPRGRSANPYVNETNPGNVIEMPSIRLGYDILQKDDSKVWKRQGLQDFHAQLRSAIEDPEQMTKLLRSAHASYDKGYLHTNLGRVLSSKIFARNMVEPNVCSYNSWLHMNWFEMATFGEAKPQHFQGRQNWFAVSCRGFSLFLN